MGNLKKEGIPASRVALDDPKLKTGDWDDVSLGYPTPKKKKGFIPVWHNDRDI